MNAHSLKPNEKRFYTDVLTLLNKKNKDYMVAGTYALIVLTGIIRETKDLDLFTTTAEYPSILKGLEDAGYKVIIANASWLSRVEKDGYNIDIIFGTKGGVKAPITDEWLQHAQKTTLFNVHTKVIAPEEYIVSQFYTQTKHGYGGSDINHIILKKGKNLNWKRILSYVDDDWELLLAHLINFRYVYPSERNLVPKWLLDMLLKRLNEQSLLPLSKDKICRGTVLSKTEYEYDIKEWGFKKAV